MISRRNFLHASLLGAGAMAFSRPERLFAAPGKPPMRFIFLHRGNGLFPKVMAPPSFDEKLAAKENRKEAFEVDLDGHDLPQWMSPLADHVDNLTILQGLSGKMCTTGHHSWCSSLGVYKANERISSIKWATVDFELAKLFPSPVEHIELACFPLDGGNARGSLDGIAQGFSARGPQQPNYAYGSPRVALSELFKTVAEDKAAQAEYQLDRMLLEFVAGNETAQARGLSGGEKSKITNYSDSIEMIRTRNAKIDAMADVIRQHVPELDPKYLDPDVNTLDRQVGHVEVLLGALISVNATALDIFRKLKLKLAGSYCRFSCDRSDPTSIIDQLTGMAGPRAESRRSCPTMLTEAYSSGTRPGRSTTQRPNGTRSCVTRTRNGSSSVTETWRSSPSSGSWPHSGDSSKHAGNLRPSAAEISFRLRRCSAARSSARAATRS